jgi:hypothetical protein
MHVNDIRAFARKVALDKEYLGKGKKVVIRAPDEMGGKYIGQSRQFDSDRANAFVFDYDRERVGQQVEACMRQGMDIEVEGAE